MIWYLALAFAAGFLVGKFDAMRHFRKAINRLEVTDRSAMKELLRKAQP